MKNLENARVIAFEGVDGAGKSTVIRRVAEHLRELGRTVYLPRTGKEHSSRPARMIRRLTRDPRNLSLCARSELLLYCARELQIIEESVKPALARGETVLLDRTLLTAEVLAGFGRGLDRTEAAKLVREISGDFSPDLTLVFDVHPRTSRIRKRLEKVRLQNERDPGRKGLAGSGFKERVRDGYVEVAQERGFPHFGVEQMNPSELAQQVLLCLQGQRVERWGVGEQPRWELEAEQSFEQALTDLETVDPALALYFARGLKIGRGLRERHLRAEPQVVAWSLDPTDPLLHAAVEACPDVALAQMKRRPFEGSQDLRARYATSHPVAVLRGLTGVACEASDALRQSLLELAPGAVVESLAGREDDVAQALRKAGWKAADPFERSESLAGCSLPKNVRRRAKLMEAWPHLGVASLRGVDGALADEVLVSHCETAPKSVLRAIAGREDESAAAIRQQCAHVGREVIDSIWGLDDDASWALREQELLRWPSTVAWSLWGLDESQRRQDMLDRCRAATPKDLHLMRRLQAFEEATDLPEWAKPRRGIAFDGEDN